MQDRHRQITPLLGCWLLGAVFCLLFSASTSPLFQQPAMTDSAIFQLMGRYWTDGLLPYRDLWDTKGPLLFLLNAAGYVLWPSRFPLGLWLLQTANMGVTFYFLYRLFALRWSPRACGWLTLLSAASLSLAAEGGNTAEEYALPWLAASFFYMATWLERWLHRHDATHSPGASLLYGLTLGIAFTTRPTDGLALIGPLLFMGGALVSERQGRQLAANAAALLAGVALVVVPFVVYFWHHHLLREVFYATIAFNFEYLASSSPGHLPLLEVLRVAKAFLNSYTVLLLALLIIFTSRHRKAAGWFWLLAAAPLVAWYLHSSAYSHYAMLALPFFPIILTEGAHLLAERHRQPLRVLLTMALGLFLLVTVAGFGWELHSAHKAMNTTDPSIERYEPLLQHVPRNERQQLMAYNTLPTFYYYFNIRPFYKFFALQQMGPEKGRSLLPKLREVFALGNARWLLVEGTETAIDDILARRYTLVAQQRADQLRLFRLKDSAPATR